MPEQKPLIAQHLQSQQKSLAFAELDFKIKKQNVNA